MPTAVRAAAAAGTAEDTYEAVRAGMMLHVGPMIPHRRGHSIVSPPRACRSRLSPTAPADRARGLGPRGTNEVGSWWAPQTATHRTARLLRH